jgi:5-keto 4-deoxyuronate isomerase
MEQYIPDTPAYVSWKYHKKRIPTYICMGVRYVLFHSDHSITRRGFYLTYAVVSGLYCSILITVSKEGDSNLHMQVESSSCDTVIRMEQYIPDTPAYVRVCTFPF